MAGCFKIGCNGCYIHGIFVNWDTCAVLLNCEKDSIQNICYCSTQIISRRAGFSCTFPTESVHYWLARKNIIVPAKDIRRDCPYAKENDW